MLPAIIGGGIALILVIVWISMKNGLIAAENQIDNALASLDVQLKQRFDLIPQLIETVKGYVKHESSVLEKLTALRTVPKTTEGLARVSDDTSASVKSLFITAEAYPELKANEQFVFLQRSMNEVEEQLAATRRTYNMSVMEFNNKVEKFPSSMAAKNLKLTTKTYLKFDGAINEPVSTHF